jgi:hypothetical protein
LALKGGALKPTGEVMSSIARRADKAPADWQHELDAITRAPLPDGWVDLIIRLNAEEDARALKALPANDT